MDAWGTGHIKPLETHRRYRDMQQDNWVIFTEGLGDRNAYWNF